MIRNCSVLPSGTAASEIAPNTKIRNCSVGPRKNRNCSVGNCTSYENSKLQRSPLKRLETAAFFHRELQRRKLHPYTTNRNCSVGRRTNRNCRVCRCND